VFSCLRYHISGVKTDSVVSGFVQSMVIIKQELSKTMSSPDRQMHPATCADCKKETQVPFQPKEGRPVYCRECLPKHRGERRF